jgi:hypothetical protein
MLQRKLAPIQSEQNNRFLKRHLVICLFSSVPYPKNYQKLLGLICYKGDVSNIRVYVTKPVLRPSRYDRYRPVNLHVNT